MSIDLSKLTPAPWTTYSDSDPRFGPCRICNEEKGLIVLEANAHIDGWLAVNPDDFAFIALARNAFDVMMRRAWSPEGCLDEWSVTEPDIHTPTGTISSSKPIGGKYWPDPFTALVEADRWMSEQEKAKP